MDFIITGTHAYGPVRPNSDLDIVVKAVDSTSIMDFLGSQGIWTYTTEGQEKYGATGGFYFDLAGIKINIIIAENDDAYAEWKRKTEKMKKFPEILDRDLRIAIFNSNIPFEQLKETVKKLHNTTAHGTSKAHHADVLSKLMGDHFQN